MGEETKIDDNIRIAATNASLEGKIRADLTDISDKVHWYIKFNIPLEPKSVSKRTMNVTDTDGYKMKTNISYEPEENSIVISPIDSYEQNRYYLLNVSKKVRSEKGNNMKFEIHILFKLLNHQIEELEILKKNAKIPKVKKRTREYEEQLQIRNRRYEEKINPTKKIIPLKNINLSIDVKYGIIGFLLIIFALPFNNFYVLLVSIILCILGFIYTIYQIIKKKTRAVFYFNYGVAKYNKGEYKKSEQYITKAFNLDPSNKKISDAMVTLGLTLI